MKWTDAETVICPDCGYEFGFRTAAGSLNLTFSPKSLRETCTRLTDRQSPEIRCPRFEEAKVAADRSERADPGGKAGGP
ncbi:MAG TPA: hypothetical protein VHG30_02975 [Microvirga sp.]|nr:hypothetical protein [Microvirga sp.]